MKTLIRGMVGSLLTVLIVTGCSNYVQNVEKPIASVSDAEVNTVADITPFVRGIQTQFTAAFGDGSLNNGGISDEMFFDRNVRGATFPQYEQIDRAAEGVLVPANNSIQNSWNDITRLRLLADTLVVRARALTAANPGEEATIASGVYTGLFYGAVVRMMMADWWSLVRGDGGGGVVEGNGPYVPAVSLRQQAIALLGQASAIGSPQNVALCNTLIARCQLYSGNYAEALVAAQAGMMSGAAPLQALFNEATQNDWFNGAGPGRDQLMADGRFKEYVDSTPSEANRIPLAPRLGNDRQTTFWQQNKYTEFGAPISAVTWQENTLMLAEISIRNSANPEALILVNAVRASHGVVDLTAEDVDAQFGGDYLEMIYTERDKELCFTGLRGMDQIRFNKWHLDPATTWQQLPISQQERNGNPNFN